MTLQHSSKLLCSQVNNDFSPPTKPLSFILWWCSGAVVLWKVKFYFIVQYMPLRPLPLLYCVVGTNKKSLKGNVTILLVRILQMYKIAKYVGLCLYWKPKNQWTMNHIKIAENLQFIYLFVELLEMFIAELKINQSTFCSHLNPTQVIFFHFGWKVQ